MDRDRIERQHRTTTEESREDAGAPEGFEPPAPSYTDETGTTDLGVAEPAVPEPLAGAPPPSDAGSPADPAP